MPCRGDMDWLPTALVRNVHRDFLVFNEILHELHILSTSDSIVERHTTRRGLSLSITSARVDQKLGDLQVALLTRAMNSL